MSIQSDRIVKGPEKSVADHKMLSGSQMDRILSSFNRQALQHDILEGTDVKAVA